MNKNLFFLILILNSIFLFGKNNNLEKVRYQFKSNKSIKYNSKAYYPNPETDEISIIESFNLINNFKDENFDFYSKSENYEEILKNRIYSQIKGTTIHQYESVENQLKYIKTSRFIQYSPAFLVNLDWKYQTEIILNQTKYSQYSYLESKTQYEGKTIKVIFYLYISPENIISKFERKAYVDNQLGQTITYEYNNYKFSNKKFEIKNLPQNYDLKYFEKSEITPLLKGTKTPNFISKDLNQNTITNKNFIGNNTVLIFSSVNCGASKTVYDFLADKNFKLSNNLNLINFYASDSLENIKKYYKNNLPNYPIIVNQKEIETEYQISGYPIMYLVNENGLISEIFDGSLQIIEYLKKQSKN